MNQNNKSKIEKLTKKRSGVAEVISTLLLVVVTVAGAIILTTFLDETFVAGSQSVVSGTDTTIKTIKLVAYDTRDGPGLMGYGAVGLDNEHSTIPELCRESCSANLTPGDGGSEFIVVQVENRSVNPTFIKNIYVDRVNHAWDPNTVGVDLDVTGTPSGGKYPSDGRFSILSDNEADPTQINNQIRSGQIVNLLIKLHSDTYPDIELSKTMRVQLNIGENSLAEFLIESGDAR